MLAPVKNHSVTPVFLPHPNNHLLSEHHCGSFRCCQYAVTHSVAVTHSFTAAQFSRSCSPSYLNCESINALSDLLVDRLLLVLYTNFALCKLLQSCWYFTPESATGTRLGYQLLAKIWKLRKFYTAFATCKLMLWECICLISSLFVTWGTSY